MDDVYLEVIIIDRVPKSGNGNLGLWYNKPVNYHILLTGVQDIDINTISDRQYKYECQKYTLN